MGTGTARGTGQRPIICQSSAAWRCAGRGCALIKQLANEWQSDDQSVGLGRTTYISATFSMIMSVRLSVTLVSQV